MGSTGRNGRGTAATRVLALLGLLLGLLAMHGLASTHHAAAAVGPMPTGTHVASLPQDPAGTHRHDPSASHLPSAAELPVGAAAGPAVPTCGDDCPSGLVVLCAAVLAGVAVTAWLVVVTVRRAVLVAPARSGSRSRAPDAARQLRPPPDLVAGLCVSRT